MNSLYFGRLHVNTGPRIEATRDLTFGNNAQFFGPSAANSVCAGALKNCYTFIGVNNNPGYIDLLPSILFRYGLTQNSALRAVHSRCVARPDPYQLLPYIIEASHALVEATSIRLGKSMSVSIYPPSVLWQLYLNTI